MPRAPFIITAAVVVAALGRAVALTVAPDPFGPGPAAVLAAWFALGGVVTAAGLLIARARWARVAAVSLCSASLALGLVHPLDGPGLAILVVAGIGLGGAAGPWLTRGWLRLLPSADGPPPMAVALVLGLLSLPAIIAAARPESLGVIDWMLAVTALAAGIGLSRALPAAVWSTRLVVPALALIAVVVDGLPGGPPIGAAGIGLAGLAWTGAVGRSVSPLVAERSRGVPMPPELVDPQILRAAGYDDRGRPLEETGR